MTEQVENGLRGEQGEKGEKGDKGIPGISLPLSTKMAFVSMILLFFLILTFFSIFITANSHRIKDIQASRVSSCMQTYAGIRLVFLPFFPKPPRTKVQQEQIDKFNVTIDKLILGCSKQTKP